MTTLTLLIPVLLIGFVQWLMPSLASPTLPFGVRVPGERAGEPVIAVQRRRYRWGTAAVTLATAAGVVLLPGHALAGMLAIVADLILCGALYVHAHRRVRAAKEAGDWFAGHRQTVVTDTSLRTDPEPYPWIWAVPPVLLLAATIVTGAVRYPGMPDRIVTHYGAGGHADHVAAKSFGSAFGPLVAQTLTTALFLLLARVAVRSRAQLDAEDSNATARHRRFVTTIARTLLVLAAFINLGFLAADLIIWDVIGASGAAVTLLAGLPPLLGAVVAVVIAVRVGQAGSRLSLPARQGAGGMTVNRDDDRLYRLGVFYVNSDDPAIFVPKRFGVGWTINLGRPLAWVVVIGTLAVLLVAPVLGSKVG